MILGETSDTNQEATEAILNFLKDIGKQRGLEILVARTSRHDPVTKQLVALGAVQNMPYAWQIRIIDYAEIFLKMKPLFEKRLASSNYRHLAERLIFNFYCYAVEFAVEDGKITSINKLDSSEERNIRVNPQVFTQLLFGYRSREELETIYPDFIIRPSHKNLIDTLFPKLPSYIHSAY